MAAAFGHDFQALDAGLTSLAALVGAVTTPLHILQAWIRFR
jgi:hypothetical protein